VFALAEKEWLTSLSSVKFEHMQYEPFVLAARQLAHDLRTNDVKKLLLLKLIKWKFNLNFKS
jgi:hypothetical protein